MILFEWAIKIFKELLLCSLKITYFPKWLAWKAWSHLPWFTKALASTLASPLG